MVNRQGSGSGGAAGGSALASDCQPERVRAAVSSAAFSFIDTPLRNPEGSLPPGSVYAGVCSLAAMMLDHLVDLSLDGLEVERGWILHRRIVDRRQRQFADGLLDQHEAPELAGKEVVAVAEGAGVGRLAADIRRAFERILPNVDHHGHVGGGLF